MHLEPIFGLIIRKETRDAMCHEEAAGGIKEP